MLLLRKSQWLLAGILLLALTLLAVGLLSTSSANAASSNAAPAAVAGDNMTSRGIQVAATRPWTREEMLAAKPYPDQAAESAGTLVTPDPMTALAGTPGTSPAGKPGGQTVSGLAVEDVMAPLSPSAITAGGYSYPAPYTGYEVFVPYGTYPYITVGKLFFQQLKNGVYVNYVCSASSVGNYAIWTAGHCVHKGNNSSKGWSKNVVFVPAYKDGTAPYGQWSASWLATKTPWYTSANLRQDMGGAVLFPLNSNKISAVVGWLGFAWNYSDYQHWDLFGYPAESPFDGQRMRVCEASFAYNLSYGSTYALTKAVGCNLNGGASGGPWVFKWGTGNYINGENSYTRVTSTGVRFKEMAGPHYDDSARSLQLLLTGGTP